VSNATHIGVRVVDADLERETELVAERFPDVPRATIDEAVRRT